MSTAKLSDIPLVALPNDRFQDLRNREDVRCPAGGTPEIGDRFDESPRLSHAFTGKCERFDLSIPEDREKYAELTAQLQAGSEYIKIWEERIPGSDGKFFVYVTYMQVMAVYQTGNDNFKLK